MKPPLCRLAAALLTCVSVVAAADQPEPPPSLKPAPEWVKIIDQGDRDPLLKGYKAPEGVKVEIIAEEPIVVHPVGLAFDERGTPAVLERQQGAKDVVRVLEDAAGKGAFDASKVVFAGEGLGDMLFYNDWLYVADRDRVRRYLFYYKRGANEVLHKGYRDVVAQGFRDLRGMSIGPDGWLYLTAGAGDNDIEGSDGSRATVPASGAVFRCRPDGSQLQAYAVGLRRPAGPPAFDAAGDLFVADDGDAEAKDGEAAECRLLHVVEGADFGHRTIGTPRPFAGVAPPMLATGRGRCGGLLVCGDARFPDKYCGLILDVFVPRDVSKSPPAVRAYQVERKGATFEVTHQFDLLTSDDPLFRPIRAAVGPDGAVYVVDSRDANMDRTHGRIYRLTWTGVKDQPALPPRGMDAWTKLEKLGDDDLVKALLTDDACDREHVRRELARRGEKERPALLKLFKDFDQPDPARMAALGALISPLDGDLKIVKLGASGPIRSMWDGDVQAAAMVVLERDSNRDVRRLAADALGLNAARNDSDVHAILLRALNDAAPEVRRAAAMAMGRIAADGAPDNLVNTWEFDDGRDPYLREGLVRAIEELGKPGVDQLIALGESGVQKDWDKMVQAFTMMRTRPAAEEVPRALENPHLSAAQRAALIRSYENEVLDPPLSLAPVVDYLIAHPAEDAAVKQAGLDVLAAGGVSAEDAFRIGDAFLDGKLPAAARPQVAQILRGHADRGDALCAKLLEAVLKGGS